MDPLGGAGVHYWARIAERKAALLKIAEGLQRALAHDQHLAVDYAVEAKEIQHIGE